MMSFFCGRLKSTKPRDWSSGDLGTCNNGFMFVIMVVRLSLSILGERLLRPALDKSVGQEPRKPNTPSIRIFYLKLVGP